MATPNQAQVSKEKPKKPNLEYQRDRDREIVTGKFINHETPGGSVEFTYRKYRGDRIEKYKFIDGEVYKVPRGVAVHVANDCSYTVHYYKQDNNGRPSQEIGKKQKRFSFIPLDFIIDDAFNKADEIITIKNI